MRKILLYSSAWALLSGTANAACIQTPSCSSLGYSSTTACEGGLKCPWGNAWFCNVGGGGSGSNPDYSNCKIGDILYSDMSCNANMVASKTPIGVVFDTTNGLAVAKDEFANLLWGNPGDENGAPNYSSTTQAQGDWWGFDNTKAMYEADKTGENYPIIQKVLQYSTTGTEKGQWYIPAVGELKAISDNKDAINVSIAKIGGTQLSGSHWSSTEQNVSNSYQITIGGSVSSSSKIKKYKLRPIINFSNKNVVGKDFNLGFGGETACEVGDILYSDKKCYINGLLGGKTPIGIVFDAENRKAIALESSPSIMEWATSRIDIPGLTNITNESKAKQDFNGKENTAAIKAYNSDLSKFYAAKYAYEYTTAGTNIGDWYLPALGELNKAYGYKDYLDYSLALVGKGKLINYTWSSTEHSYLGTWGLVFSNGYVDYDEHNNYIRLNVLPALAF